MRAATSTSTLQTKSISGLIALIAFSSLVARNAHGMEAAGFAASADSITVQTGWWRPGAAPAPHLSLLALSTPYPLIAPRSEQTWTPKYQSSADPCARGQSGCGYSPKLYAEMLRGVALPRAPHQPPADFPNAYPAKTNFGGWINYVSLRSEVMLYTLDANYAAWQSELAETHPRMRTKGGSVYALAQLNAPGGISLPIGMYVMPLRGSAGGLR